MPFGLCNTGATFQRLMDIVMAGLNLEICLVYLDDIIVYSSTVEEHLQRLDVVLGRLRRAGLKLKPEKCALLQKSVSFLGHVISDQGIGTNPEKVRAVMDWPRPTCIREVRAFLGLASYYRRFVKDFADIAAPLNALTKKNHGFCWSEEAEISFKTLKQVLSTPPILAMPCDSGDFILDTDASDRAIGAVLSQRQDGVERVVAYASRALDRREQNYCVTRKELLAIVHFMKYFRQYLLGREFKVRTDHAALSWLRTTPEPIGQQARWLEQMEEFCFTIEHRPGVRHGNADALSRRPCPRRDCACHASADLDRQSELVNGAHTFGGPADQPTSISRQVTVDDGHASNAISKTAGNHTNEPEPNMVLPWSLEGLRLAQRGDPDIGCVLQLLELSTEKPIWEAVALKSRDVKTLWGMWSRLAVRDGLLKRRFESIDGKTEFWQIIWPKNLREEFLSIAHGGMTGGHLGRAKTAATIQSRAYWPTWSSDLIQWIKKCAPCARYHRGSVPHRAEMQVALVGEPLERVSIDITGPHPKSSRGNQFILTVVDHFSKWAEAVPLANHTAPVVARALMVHVFSRFGVPRQLLSDQGPEFESELFAQLMRWLEIDKLRTTSYKPSTNGVAERFHRTLNSMLGKVVCDSQRDWDERLPLVMAAYRASPHNSTGFSPNQLFLGRENRMPLDLLMGLPAEEVGVNRTADQFVTEMRDRAEAAYSLAREHLRVAAERRKATYDMRVKKSECNVGDWVWYYYPRRYQGKSMKWQKHYTGPFLIVRLIQPVNYVLQRTERSQPFVVHADKIKKCWSQTPESWLIVDNRGGEASIPTLAASDIRDPRIGSKVVPDRKSEPRPTNGYRKRVDGPTDESIIEMNSRPSRRNRRPPRRLRDYSCNF